MNDGWRARVSSLTSKMKGAMPWQAKIAAKVMLARLGVGYKLWKRLSLFEHGTMDRPDYALGVFETHFQRLIKHKPDLARGGFSCLEMGPGDSLLSALIARAYGAENIYLSDVGDFAERDVQIYNDMAALLQGKRGDILPHGGFRSLEHVLEHCNATYLTGGIDGMGLIPDNSVNFVWSQAVLEHIRLSEFEATLGHMHRILTPDGIASHQVDLADHLGGALNNLRFSQRMWESDFLSSSGFYTNRIRFENMLELFERADFLAEVQAVKKWPQLPTKRSSMVAPYCHMKEDDLLVRDFSVLMWPK